MSEPDPIERQAMGLMAEALDQPEAIRLDWLKDQCAGNELLYLRTLALLDADSRQTVLATGGAGADSVDIDKVEAPERVGAYKITGLIGQGGMGAVYLGERDAGDFDHRVAIKVIRAGTLRMSLAERFNRERQILASLNHPNIARLFDGGYLDDGSPYIVMEHVDGEPVLDWADAQNLDRAQRLDLFVSICSAIGYAHQNLIVHRDITPSNVLVTRDGIVKLIDFGIAKPHDISALRDTDRGSSATIASLSFTPGYAAPERARGAGANTLSDIYSLGKLLDDLIRDPGRELQAIIDKAGATDPVDRYPSIDALTDDITNLSHSRPVEAMSGGAGYKFAKYLQRRRLAVAFGTLAVAGMAAALIVTLIQYSRAETALADANARFTQARNLSNALIFDVYDSFDKIAGTLEPRRELADLVQTYVNALNIDENAPEDVLFEVGTIQLRLSDLYGGIGVANFGDLKTSQELLAQAEANLKLALEKSPENAEALAELIMVKRSQTMQSLNYENDIEAAKDHNLEARQLTERALSIRDAEERPFLRHLWSVRTDLLQIYFAEERFEDVVDSLAAWRLELTPKMYERLGGGEEMGAYLAFQEAETLNAMDRSEQALAPSEDAIAYRRAQLRDAPDNYYQMTQLMVALAEKATALRKLGHLDESLKHVQQAVVLARRIRAADTEDAGGLEGLARMLNRQAGVELETGNKLAAGHSAAEAITLSQALVGQFPEDEFYQQVLAESLVMQAKVLAADSAPEEACSRFTEAMALVDQSRGEIDDSRALDALCREN